MPTKTKPRKPVARDKRQESPKAQAPKAKPGEPGPFNAGVTTKDSRYLARIIDATESKKHPRHQGIGMQAHHVISVTGMHKSGLADKIRKFGYNINLLENLVFLPCTLQGACHLGVQPHRGNHTAPSDPDFYQNDVHPRDYHNMVELRLKGLELGLTKSCPGYMGGAKELEARRKVKNELDELSAKILRLIQNVPTQAPLTTVAASFQPGNPVGCGGVDSTPEHVSTHQCAVGRNHLKRQRKPGQKPENISFESDGKYKLQIGC